MAFDINNQAHFDRVKAILLEPDFVAAGGSIADVMALLNDPERNSNGPIYGPARLTARNIVDAIFNATIGSSDQFKIDLLVNAASSLDDDLSEFRLRLMGLSTQLQDEILLNTRKLSRIESEFGVLDSNGVHEYTSITLKEYVSVRDS